MEIEKYPCQKKGVRELEAKLKNKTTQDLHEKCFSFFFEYLFIDYPLILRKL